MKAGKKRIVAVIMVVLMLLLEVPALAVDYSRQTLSERYTYGRTIDEITYTSESNVNYYLNHLAKYEEKGYAKTNMPTYTITPDQFKKGVDKDGNEIESNSALGKYTDDDGVKKVGFYWEPYLDYIEFEITVEKTGLYQMDASYFMPKGSSNNAVRSLYIDGKQPFIEAASITFRRLFNDDLAYGESSKVNSIGDEVRPAQKQLYRWQTAEFRDSQGLYEMPFLFYLEKGTHTVRLEAVEQTMVLGEITLHEQQTYKTYAEMLVEYQQKGYKNVSADATLTFQAENTVINKNSPTLRRENNGEPSVTPRSIETRKLNVLGGSRWAKGGQSITWKFTVSESGLYAITMHLYQKYNQGLPSYRQIRIDGEIPFEEMLCQKFVYDDLWQTRTLTAEDGNPYLFYLDAGEHTITMDVTMGELTKAILSVNDDSLLVSQMILDITSVAGNSPDPNYDYNFFRVIPSLKTNLETLMASLQWKYDYLHEICGDKLPSMANNFLSIMTQMEAFIEDPFTIARNVGDFTNAQSSLGSYYTQLLSCPLLLDDFTFRSADVAEPKYKSNFFQKFWTTAVNFYWSFKKDYNNIGSVLDGSVEITDTIEVWISRGTEYCETVKEMADESFTPESGIQVVINILPAGQVSAGTINTLMLAIIANRAPDVAMGVGVTSPVEFAIRDAVIDLSQFDGYEELSKKFVEGVLVPYEYDSDRDGVNEVYALPETMNFAAIFYREDIISQYGIPIPNTREELYSYTLPALYQNGFEFYYNKDFTALLFQNGGEYYSDNGLYTALDSTEAFLAFQEYCQIYTHYGVPVSANFYNRFRSGQMPMGIGGFSLYTQLSIAAPELAGKWKLAPLPGVLLENGEVDRSNGAVTETGAVILAQSEKPEQAWDFLEWWMSTETQVEYAQEVEAIMGAEARWNTANTEAFLSLSFDVNDITVIQEMWRWVDEMPTVLGGYYTSRYINNAWTTVVVSGGNLRDALEEACDTIDRELRSKQEEYGIFADEITGGKKNK